MVRAEAETGPHKGGGYTEAGAGGSQACRAAVDELQGRQTDAGYTGTKRCIAHPVYSGNEIQ